MESTDMDMIDYSGEDALEILFSDPFFEVLRTTRYTSLVLFSGGVHGVFFTSEVAVARAHHGTMPGLNPLETDVVHGRRALHGSVDSLDKGEESTSSEPTDRHTSPPLTGITPEREERRPGSPRRSGEQASPSIGLGVQAGSLSIKNGEQTLSPTLLVDGFELNPDDDIDEEAAFGHWSAQHDKYEAAMAHNLADSSSGVESSASEAWQVTEARYGPADWRTLEARYGPRYLESATGMRLGDPNPRHPANHDSPLPLWHPRSSRRRNGEQTGEHGLGAHPGERGLTLLGEADGTPSAQPKHPRRSHGATSGESGRTHPGERGRKLTGEHDEEDLDTLLSAQLARDKILPAQRLEDLRTATEVPPGSPKRKWEVISDKDYRLRKERTDGLVEGLRHVWEKSRSPSRGDLST